jgi:hypothetical protein
LSAVSGQQRRPPDGLISMTRRKAARVDDALRMELLNIRPKK